MRNTGIALILVVLLILITSLAILGISTFLFQNTRLSVLKINNESAAFLAQAGVNKAISDYGAGSYTGPASFTQVVTNLFYKYGKEADYLSVNASRCYFLNYTILENIPLRNVSSANNITVKQMIVEWDTTGGAKLRDIYLGGVKRNTASLNAASGQLITLDPVFTITAGSSYNDVADNRWEFDSAVTPIAQKYNAALAVTFIMNDDSRREVIIINRDFRTGNNEFGVTSTGRVGSGTGAWKRTIEATYDTGKNVITSWQEMAQHLN